MGTQGTARPPVPPRPRRLIPLGSLHLARSSAHRYLYHIDTTALISFLTMANKKRNNSFRFFVFPANYRPWRAAKKRATGLRPPPSELGGCIPTAICPATWPVDRPPTPPDRLNPDL